MRALAILAVLVFHLDPSWLPGGFLGVDVFFVVSGFLITTLLVRERVASGRIDLPGFWSRRARRLLPALLVCVPASVLLARLSEGDLLVGIERQVLGAFTFTSNWLEIGAGTDYFAATSPQLLMNLWSLAVEEQFYLLWPLAVLGLLALTRRPEVRAASALGLAVVSAALMALRLDPDSPTRVYYGTDTHVMGLMLGAALAFVYAAPHRAWTTSTWWAEHRRQVAAVALVTLLGLMALGGEDSALTFRGGILLASVATTALVLVVVERPGRLRAAARAAARAVGRCPQLRHLPVALAGLPRHRRRTCRSPRAGPTYLLTRLWCVVVTFVVADLSYRFVETPVRRHGFAGSARRATARLRRLGTKGARIVWSVVLVLVLALVAVLLTAPDRTSTEAAHRRQRGRAGRRGALPRRLGGSAATKARPRAKTTPAAVPAVWTMPKGSEIDAFGDSMMVGAIHAMRYYLPKVRVDAKSNRKWREAPGLVDARGDSLRRAVVLAFGTNAGTDEKAIRRTLAEIGPNRMVVIVTEHGRLRPRRDRQRAAARHRQGHAERAPRRLGRRARRHQRPAAARRHPPEPEGLTPLREDGAAGVRRPVAGAHREAGAAQEPADALTPRGRGWQRGQENDERFMKCSRRMGVPHLRHGRPAWP